MSDQENLETIARLERTVAAQKWELDNLIASFGNLLPIQLVTERRDQAWILQAIAPPVIPSKYAQLEWHNIGIEYATCSRDELDRFNAWWAQSHEYWRLIRLRNIARADCRSFAYAYKAAASGCGLTSAGWVLDLAGPGGHSYNCVVADDGSVHLVEPQSGRIVQVGESVLGIPGLTYQFGQPNEALKPYASMLIL